MKSDRKGSLTCLVINVARLAVGLAVSVVFLMSRDVYSSPFPGCETRGFFTLQPGCSSWSDFISGFGMVLLIAVIGGERIHAKFIGLAIVIFLAIIGGPGALQTGNYLYVLDNLNEVLFSLHWILSPLLLGGVVAYSALTFLPIVFRRFRRDKAS